MDHPIITCKFCEEKFPPLIRECPKCGWLNPDFFSVPPDQREEVCIWFWHERGVYNAVVNLAKKREKSIETLYREAIEICISKGLL